MLAGMQDLTTIGRCSYGKEFEQLRNGVISFLASPNDSDGHTLIEVSVIGARHIKTGNEAMAELRRKARVVMIAWQIIQQVGADRVAHDIGDKWIPTSSFRRSCFFL